MNPKMQKLNIHRVVAALLVILLLATLLPTAFAAETSGSCGEGVTWKLKNGKLTVSGNGAMTDYTQSNPAPWHDRREQIQRIVVEQGVTSIGSQAFYNCTNLTVVTTSNSVKKIGRYAFYACGALTQVHLANGVESIGVSAFEGCASLPAISLPNSLTKIDSRAFYRCESLGGVTIPLFVSELGDMVFGYCYRLNTVTVKASIRSLPYWFFYGCVGLEVIYLPETVQNIEENALSECPSLVMVDYNGSAKVKAQIEDAMHQETTLEADKNRVTDYQETANSTIFSDTNYPQDGSAPEKLIDTTVNNAQGWQEVVDYINSQPQTIPPKVNVEVKADVPINGEALQKLAGQDVTINIHTDQNNNWQIDMSHQTSEGLKKGQEISTNLAVYNPTKDQKETLGDGASYTLTLGETNWNTTVQIPLGVDAARDVASLYQVEKNNSLSLIQSVIVDNDGKAAFSLAGTSAGEYVLALNAKDVSQSDVRIPPALYEEYGIDPEYTLMGMDGNYYAITGQKSSLGLTIGQMTLIIVAVLVTMLVTVGGVMFYLNKRKLQRGYVPDMDDDEE